MLAAATAEGARLFWSHRCVVVAAAVVPGDHINLHPLLDPLSALGGTIKF